MVIEFRNDKHYLLCQTGQQCLQQLMQVWFDFERQLNRVPIIRKLENRQFQKTDYQELLLHLRQQVIEGSRWISRGASSFERHYSDVRSEVIRHAKDEHRDYELLEQDFVAVGGELDLIRSRKRNIGTEALHGFMMHRASQTNPIDLIGAMWIIEGLGQKMAEGWATQIEACLDADAPCTQFMRYHGENDEAHMRKFYHLLDRVCQSEADITSIIRTARVVARLYTLQLEEIEHA